MKKEFSEVYMGTALLHSRLSKAVRAKVGAALVTNTGVVVPGYNGTPAGTDNNCEHSIDGKLVTKDETIHAELNCILKCAKEGVSCIDSTIYVTLEPCLRCAAMLKQAGVKSVFFLHEYSSSRQGANYLRQYGVSVHQINEQGEVIG